MNRKNKEKKSAGFLALFFEQIIRLLYPDRCPGCDEQFDILWQYKNRRGAEHRNSYTKKGFCPECEKKIICIEDKACMRCGKYLKDLTREYCSDCQKKRHLFVQGKAAFLYTGPMKDAMYRFKYSNRRCYARVFAYEMVRANERWIKSINPEVIIPVPMYRRKMRKRGYNQAEVLAKEISKITGISFRNDLLIRTRNTAPMKSLSEAERKQNLFNAFKLRKNGVKFKSVLLVDDIFTTGSTFDHISEVLGNCADRIYCVSACAGSDK